MKKKILITGGAGFIGSHLANYYHKKNFKIYIVDNLSTGFKSNLINKFIFINKNCEDKSLLKEEYLDTNFKIFQKLDKIKGSNISRIYPHKIFCNEIICQAVDSENILFVDTVHMSMEGSLKFSNNLIPLLNKF